MAVIFLAVSCGLPILLRIIDKKRAAAKADKTNDSRGDIKQ